MRPIRLLVQRPPGISLPTPIPIGDITDMTILKKDNYFTMAEEPLSPYLEVTERTKHYLHNSQCLYYVGVMLVLQYNQYDVLYYSYKK